MTKDEALKLALSTLDEVRQETFRLMKDSQTLYSEKKVWEAIYTIKKVLAQPYQEPVAYGTWDTMLGKGHRMMMVRLDKGQDGCTVPLYTTPSQRKPLTDEEIDCLWSQSLADTEGETWLPLREFARAIEAAHGIKE